MHEIIKMGDVFYNRPRLMNMEKLTNDMVEPVPVQTINNQLTEMIPDTFLKVDFYGLHPESSSTSEIYSG